MQITAQGNYNLETFSNDFGDFTNKPINWDRNEWLTFIGIAGLTYGSMHIDEFVRERVIENNIYQRSILVELGRIWGEPYATLIAGGGIYLHGILAGNKANEKIGFEIGESAIFTGLLTLLLKYSFGRERPRENSDAFSFQPFSFKGDNFLSINSGHTALGFSLSTVLAKNTDNNLIKAVFYLPAFLTAFSRVYQNHHWFSDVLLGGIIGYSVGEFVTKQHKPKTSIDLGLNQSNPIPLFFLKIPVN
jgi:membrane-associated phospholipid phosphatase